MFSTKKGKKNYPRRQKEAKKLWEAEPCRKASPSQAGSASHSFFASFCLLGLFFLPFFIEKIMFYCLFCFFCLPGLATWEYFQADSWTGGHSHSRHQGAERPTQGLGEPELGPIRSAGQSNSCVHCPAHWRELCKSGWVKEAKKAKKAIKHCFFNEKRQKKLSKEAERGDKTMGG